MDLSSYLTSSVATATYLPLAGGTLTGDVNFTTPKKARFQVPSPFTSSYGWINGAWGGVGNGDGIQIGVFSGGSNYNLLRIGSGAGTISLDIAGTTLITSNSYPLKLNGSTLQFSCNSSIYYTMTNSGAFYPENGVFDQRNGANAQTFRLYNTYTSSTSFENLQFKAVAAAAYQIGSAIGSAGGTNRAITFGHWNTAGTFVGTAGITAAGRLSDNAGFTEAEVFGVGATGAAYSTLFGYGAASTGSGVAVVFGGSGSAGSQSAAFGYLAVASGSYSVALGNYTTSSFASSIALGRGAVTGKVNQLVIGATGADGSAIGAISEVSVGGNSSATPYGALITSCSGLGTNIAGASFTLAGGKGTGTGLGGSLKFQVAPVGSSGSSANTLVDALVIDSTKLSTFTGPITLTQPVSTTGSPTAFTITGAAHTTLTLSTEATDVNFNLSRTVQFATGALTTQRAVRIQAPTYSFVGASTITTASTLSISGPPVAGTNATITNAYALNVEDGASRFSRATNGTVLSVFGSQSGTSYEIVNITNNGGNPNMSLGSSANSVFTIGSLTLQASAVTVGGGWGSFGQGAGGLGIFSGEEVILQPATGYPKVQQFNGTTAQIYELYCTYTSSSSYERLNLKSKASANFEIGPENGSAGGTLRGLTIGGYALGSAPITGCLQFRPNATTAALEAFYLGPIADSTAVGGNARGLGAVDLQFSRATAAQVASGQYSFVCGTGNTASNYYAFAAGNTCSAAYNAFCYGETSTASGNYSTAIGRLCTASGVASFATGQNSLANRTGMRSHANGQFAAAGDSQYARFVCRIKTTDNTATTVTLDGSTTKLTITSGKIMFCDILISGIKSDGSAAACYKRKVAIKNVGGTTSLVGAVEAIGTDIEDNVLTDVAITADNTNDALDISVTGIAAETWRWVCTVEGLEIAYGT
jgi:hypothetical protein